MTDSVQYLPFESVWKMQIDHPYSLFVRDADLFWSCGQCPLNEQGQVQSPNNLLTQATIVAGFIKKFLSDIHCDVASVAQLVVYYVPTGDSDGQTLRNAYHQHFGPEVIVLTIAIPHFYYDGMMIEVDVFGSTQKTVSSAFSDAPLTSPTLEIIDAGQLKWASLLVPSASGQSLKDATNRLFKDAGLSFDNLLSEQWFATTTDAAAQIQSMRSSDLANPCQIVETTHDSFDIVGQLAFSSAPVLRESDDDKDDGVAISMRRAGDLFEIMGMCEAADAGLVEQTRRIMRGVERTIKRAKLSFAQVRKVTTYYVGGSSADELHDNMS